MSDLVTKLRDLDEKATRAPWEQGVYDGGTLFRGDGAFIEFPPAPNVVPDVRAIVALRNALPALIEYVKERTPETEAALLAALRGGK